MRQSQVRRIAESFVRVSQSLGETPRTVVVGGQGEFLAREMLRFANWTGPVVGLSETQAASGGALSITRIAGGASSSVPSGLRMVTGMSVFTPPKFLRAMGNIWMA